MVGTIDSTASETAATAKTVLDLILDASLDSLKGTWIELRGVLSVVESFGQQ